MSFPSRIVLTAPLMLAALHAAVAQTKAAASTPAQEPVAAKTVWPGEGPMKWAPRPTVPAISANDLRTRLYQLADDSMQGRKVGQLGNWKGTEYIAREFKRLGLKPAGDNGGYFQELDYGPVSADSTARLSIAGTPLGRRTEWYPTAPNATNGAAAAVTIASAPAVFVGRWDDSTSDLGRANLSGKIAVFLASAANAGGGGRGGRGGGGGGRGGAGAGGAAAPAACDADQGFPAPRGAAYALANTAGRGGGGRGGAAAPAAATAADSAAGGRGGAAAAGRGGRGGAGAAGAGAAGGGGGGRGRNGGGAAAGPVALTGRMAQIQAAGAVGILLIADTLPRNAAGTAFGVNAAMSMKPANATPATGGLPSANISSAAAVKLFRKPVAQLAMGDAGQSVSASWTYAWHKSPTPARNVVAILPGSDPSRAAQYVLLSAHNDHNGVNATSVDHDSLRAWNAVMRPQGANDNVRCTPNAVQQHLIDSMITRARKIRPIRRDSIMNGADDDGSGTVVLLEVAERFATEHPARSIIFVSHTGEEAGLLGSKWFTDHPTIPLDSVVAALNMDMVGKGRVTDVAFGGPNSVQTLGSRREATQFGEIIDSVNAVSPEPMVIDRTWDVQANPLNRFCRSDQVNYVKHNVPVTYFSLGYAEDYHQPTDEPQYIDYDHAARLGRWMHELMTALANRKDRPFKDGPSPNYPAC